MFSASELPVGACFGATCALLVFFSWNDCIDICKCRLDTLECTITLNSYLAQFSCLSSNPVSESCIYPFLGDLPHVFLVLVVLHTLQYTVVASCTSAWVCVQLQSIGLTLRMIEVSSLLQKEVRWCIFFWSFLGQHGDLWAYLVQTCCT